VMASAPSAPGPTMSRWPPRGMSSATERGVCPNWSRSGFEGPFRRLRTRPPSITTSEVYRSPSIWTSPNATSFAFTRAFFQSAAVPPPGETGVRWHLGIRWMTSVVPPPPEHRVCGLLESNPVLAPVGQDTMTGPPSRSLVFRRPQRVWRKHRSGGPLLRGINVVSGAGRLVIGRGVASPPWPPAFTIESPEAASRTDRRHRLPARCRGCRSRGVPRNGRGVADSVLDAGLARPFGRVATMPAVTGGGSNAPSAQPAVTGSPTPSTTPVLTTPPPSSSPAPPSSSPCPRGVPALKRTRPARRHRRSRFSRVPEPRSADAQRRVPGPGHPRSLIVARVLH
jgi:hypothetical protein